MTAPKNMAEAIRNVRLIDGAWENWQNQQPADDAPQDEGDAWQIGWDTFGSAHEAASDIVRGMPCDNLSDAATKARFLVNEMEECSEPWRWAALDMLATDLARMIDRPTQDAFAVKMRAYERAVQDCNEAKASGADDAVMGPLYSAAFDCGKAVMLEPAPDIAALIEKRRIFDALQYDEDADAPTVTHRLFADAIALAGGAA
ncbi:hypothetical protein [Sphingopyxis sp. GW247-27LB]|uniref:hypothetical protein n=1 Tax=Sphingopyxis sp. GW247-27LB TaxID=2012632 RepID=UPI000BA760FB|nr:hypothetical protein [Sphingopyxis sp. GW247-27LB]PAL24534.1 hypothetical protein CD928_03810 [Sphingopyxis sp. GW247-27LB]